MAEKTVRRLADRLVELGMAEAGKAAEVLAGIRKWTPEHLDEELDEANLRGWLSEFGVAVSVHGEDVDFVDEYYRHLLEEEVRACTGGAVVITEVTLVETDEGYEYLFFRRNGEPVWWSVEHVSHDYVDQGSVAEQFDDLDPGGADPRVFYQVEPEKFEGCQDDVHVLATPEQAKALHDEFGLDFHGLGRVRPRRGEPPTARPGTTEWYMQEDRRYMTEPAKVFLDRWVSDMDEEIDRWRPAAGTFDFSLESLDALGRLVLDRFADRAAVRAAADDPFVVGAVRYLGETLVRNAPAHWAYREVEGWVYDKVPMIRSNTPRAFLATVVPLSELAYVAHSREPGLLARSAAELHEAADRYAQARRALAEAQAT